ncbi:DNA repair protein RecO [Leucothrix arctica]|uniref:DNA repair protein RecO n=1 Tax=Leucothrix arctica TaxID=1481894 RepID=A0A317CKC6_9GAMM|nr:DNA repair protein RecO [Leucothrix arctica]PWQ98956.1 DNA repair protein RecO [Leucothrix arctica]
MASSTGYILRTRPYTESNVIVDLFTHEQGRLTCMARPAKVRGKVQKGHLQAFRLLQFEWQGRGEMGKLTQTDERYRHRIPAGHLLYGLYLNELLLKCLKPHTSLDGLYENYQRCLSLLVDSEIPMIVLMRFELLLLEGLGHIINLWQLESSDADILVTERYIYRLGIGMSLFNRNQQQMGGIPVSGELLVALRSPELMDMSQYSELRVFLDHLWLRVLGKPLNSRKLLIF